MYGVILDIILLMAPSTRPSSVLVVNGSFMEIISAIVCYQYVSWSFSLRSNGIFVFNLEVIVLKLYKLVITFSFNRT